MRSENQTECFLFTDAYPSPGGKYLSLPFYEYWPLARRSSVRYSETLLHGAPGAKVAGRSLLTAHVPDCLRELWLRADALCLLLVVVCFSIPLKKKWENLDQA